MASTSSQHVFEFIGKVDSLQKASKASADSLTKIEKGTQKLGAASKTFLAGAAVAAVGAFVASSVNAAREAEVAQNRLEAVFKATGETTGQAAEEAAEYAGELSKLIGVDDETIMAGQALLVTFKNVSSEAARSAGVFDRATAAAADLAAAGFGTLEGNAKLLGKALNDPATGMAKLAKSGVTFTEAQKEAIAVMVESGDLLGAQKIILAEIEAQVGGTAEATASSFDKMGVAVGELQEQLGGALMPLFEELPGLIDAATPAFEAFSAGLEVIIDAVTGVDGALLQAAAAVPILAAALVLLYANPVIAGLGGVVALVIAIGSAAKTEKANVEALTAEVLALGEASEGIVSELFNPQAMAAADELGVSIEEITRLVNGTTKEIDAWETAQLKANASNGEASEFVRILVGNIRNLNENYGDATIAAEAHGEEQKRLANAALESGSALDHERDALYGATEATDDATDSTKDHTDALQKQMDKLRAALDPVFAFRDAKRSQRDAENEATAALEEFGQNSPEYREALDNLTESTLDTKEAALGLAGVNLDKYRDELIKSGIRSGLTAQQAEKMADDVIADLERINDKVLNDKSFDVTAVYQTVGGAGERSYAAAGGSFDTGDIVTVGERGPEVVMFGKPGTVIPNDHISTVTGGGGGGFTQVIVVNLNQPVVGDRALQDIVVSSITHAQQRGRLPKPDRQDVAPVKRQRTA